MERSRKMNRRLILLSFASCMVLGLAFYAGVLRAFADTGEPVIIANLNVGLESLDPEEIKNIFLGKKTKWEDGNPITFVLLSDQAVHETFLKKYIDFTPRQFSRYWRGLLFAGKGSCPKTLSEAEVLQFVAQTEGAIGYVLKSNDRVKTITVK